MTSGRKRFSQGRTPLRVTAAAMATLLSGCDQPPTPPREMPRQVYASKADCLADWNMDERSCQAATSGGTGGRAGWYGPYLFNGYGYYPGGGFGAWNGSAGRSVGVTQAPPPASIGSAFSAHQRSIARGGMGSTGRGMSAGG